MAGDGQGGLRAGEVDVLDQPLAGLSLGVEPGDGLAQVAGRVGLDLSGGLLLHLLEHRELRHLVDPLLPVGRVSRGLMAHLLDEQLHERVLAEGILIGRRRSRLRRVRDAQWIDGGHGSAPTRARRRGTRGRSSTRSWCGGRGLWGQGRCRRRRCGGRGAGRRAAPSRRGPASALSARRSLARALAASWFSPAMPMSRPATCTPWASSARRSSDPACWRTWAASARSAVTVAMRPCAVWRRRTSTPPSSAGCSVSCAWTCPWCSRTRSIARTWSARTGSVAACAGAKAGAGAAGCSGGGAGAGAAGSTVACWGAAPLSSDDVVVEVLAAPGCSSAGTGAMEV